MSQQRSRPSPPALTQNAQPCPWCLGSPAYRRYHDEEWGVPQRNDRVLFEFLILEGAQAGLSWRTILEKREGYRRAFADFDPKRVAAFTDQDLDRLLAEGGIVRNRLKVASARHNARAFLDLQSRYGRFADYLWGFVDGRPQVNRFTTPAEVPARTELSDRISRDLQQRGFKFVGSTIVYAYLQAMGLVNDHLLSCPRHAELASQALEPQPPSASLTAAAP